MTPEQKELEYSTIGCILNKTESRLGPALAAGITQDWFHDPNLKLILEALTALNARSEEKHFPMSTVLNEAIRISGKWDGWDAVYTLCMTFYNNSASKGYKSLTDYIPRLLNRYIRERGCETLNSILPELSSSKSASETLSNVISSIKNIISPKKGGGDYNLSAFADEFIADAKERAKARRDGKTLPASGIPLPWDRLNAVLGGFQPGGVHIIAARPSVGKTSLVMQIMSYLANRGYHVAFNCLDMGWKNNTKRFFASAANVSLNTVANGKPSDDEIVRLENTAKQLKRWDREGLYEIKSYHSINDFREWCYAKKATDKLDIVIVDYVQQFRIKNEGKAENDRLTDIILDLKSMAIDLQIPVVVLSQLNRDSSRDDRPPQMSDLRGSGSLEQDAFSISLLYPDKKVLETWENSPPKDLVPKAGFDTDKHRELLHSLKPIYWSVVKNQNGMIGEIPFVAYNAFFKWFMGDENAECSKDNSLPLFSRLTVDYREDEFPLKQLMETGKVLKPDGWDDMKKSRQMKANSPKIARATTMSATDLTPQSGETSLAPVAATNKSDTKKPDSTPPINTDCNDQPTASYYSKEGSDEVVENPF